MLRFSAKTAIVLTASGALALAAPALAQTPPAQPAQPPAADVPATAAQDIKVDDRQLRSFALALVEVDKIQRKYQPRLEAAEASEREAIAQQANQNMAAAVEAQGLDPQTFNAISVAAKDDPQLRAKIRDELSEVAPAAPQR